MEQITISVVIASYNGAEYLIEQLDSIRKQTLPPDELIICDDRSKDDTVKIAQDYIKQYHLEDKWYVTVNDINLGYADNFDKVTRLAKGDLIFFSDQDDVWDLKKIEIMTRIMGEHPECKVLCSDYMPWYTSVDAPKAPKSIIERMPNNGILEMIKLNKRSIYIGALGCCMCVRKSFYHSILSYRFEGWAQDDRMWKMAQCAHGCLILHKNLTDHRIHGHNTSTYGKYHTVERRVKLFEQMLEAEKQMLAFLSDTDATQREIKLVNRHISMMQKRIKLLKEKKMLKIIPLISDLPYYEKKKSYLVEIMMVVKAKR